MIYDPTQVLLATAIMEGVSPNLRESLRSITVEMLPDRFCADIYNAVMALDNFNASVSLNAVYEQLDNISFSDLGAYVKDVIFTKEPFREAQQIKNAFNDKRAVNDLGLIISQIQSGKVFDRNEISETLNKLSVDLAPVSETKPIFFSEYEESYLKILEARESNPDGCFLDIGLEVEINKTDMIVLGGQPAMGKTALALYINDYVANQGKPTLIFSLEMDGNQLFERQVSAKSNVSSSALKKIGKQDLRESEWGCIGAALKDLNTKKIAIDDNAKLSIPILIKKCRDFKEKHPDLALITIDYLTLMDLPNASRRDLEVAEATRQLKLLAKDLKTPVLILSQLNRDAAKAMREPMNSDLRDSGAIEQDADKIIFPYREEVHTPDTPNKGLAKILKTKVRDGETGAVVLGFKNGAFCESWGNWSEPVVEEPKQRQKF